MNADSLTTFLHIKTGQKTSLENTLRIIGNPIKQDNPHLHFGPHTHFARMVILPGPDKDVIYPGQETDDSSESRRYRLMLNAVFDGTPRTFIKELIDCSSDLDAVFNHCEGYSGIESLHTYLTDPAHMRTSQIFYDTFIGETVESIQKKARQRIIIQNILDQKLPDLDEALDKILQLKPVPDGLPINPGKTARQELLLAALLVGGSIIAVMAVLWFISPVVAILAFLAFLALLAEVLVPAVMILRDTSAIGAYGAIRDQVNEHDERQQQAKAYYPVDMMTGREDVLVQNQFNLYLTFKGGWLERHIRLLRMMILMFVLGRGTKINPTPGSLGGLTTVHFGHWVLIDGGRRLFFITNYDGAWETYIADFVNKIHRLLDVQLHNFVGFSPEGTRDITAFRRWLRRVQIQSGVFYSAYPFLTVRNIQRDLRINAEYPADRASAYRWLVLFGSPPLNQPYRDLPPVTSDEVPRLTRDDWSDIQSFIVYGYARLPVGRYLFLHIDDVEKARSWLQVITPFVTTVQQWDADEMVYDLDVAFNLALTYPAMELFKLPEDTLRTFSTQFREGMAPPGKGDDLLHPRSIVLGDTGESSPLNWRIGNPTQTGFHILLILSGMNHETISHFIGSTPLQHIYDSNAGVTIVHDESGATPRTGREPFGFRDGISNPWIEGTRYNLRKRDGKRGEPLCLSDTVIVKEQEAGEPDRVISLLNDPVIRSGEFILGYPNEYGQLPQTPLVWDDPTGRLSPVRGSDIPESLRSVKDFGRNGSYLVYRKLSQNVESFWQYMAENNTDADGKPVPLAMQKTAAKMVGRWPSGVPLTLSPDSDDIALRQKATDLKNHSLLNDFKYRPNDEHGLSCPFGSHLRRGNPRDSLVDDTPNESGRNVNLHRIMRRAVSFGKLCDHQLDPDYFHTHGAPLEVTHNLADDYPEDPDGIGIHFFGINTSIQRQFEFIQQAWNNNGKFNGMFSNKDPIVGDNPDHLPRVDRLDNHVRYAERSVDLARLQPSDMTIPEQPVRRRLDNIPRFVTVRGGAYLFIPGIAALQFLAELK